MKSPDSFEMRELQRKSELLLQNLKNEQERERSIFTLVPIGILIATDASCEEIIHNPASADIFRIPVWRSMSFSGPTDASFHIFHEGKLLFPEEMPVQRAAWRGEEIDNMELTLHWADGVKKTVQMSSRPLFNKSGEIIGALATVKDITELKELEEALTFHNDNLELIVRERTETILKLENEITRLGRLDLMGELAGSIGHEVRNPLTTIRGYLQLLLQNKNLRDADPIYETMIEELDRANAIITEFLSIAKHKKSEFSESNLNDIINTLFPLLEAKGLLENAVIRTDLGPIPPLFLDGKLIRQLILNLVRNGFEAMSAGGMVTISTYTEGEAVVLSVKDQGHGIPPEHWINIGNPFYTTKEDGTGLGLAVCYSIARKHDAKIDFTSSSAGTTFFVRFKTQPFLQTDENTTA